jgi:hypothetical protein
MELCGQRRCEAHFCPGNYTNRRFEGLPAIAAIATATTVSAAITAASTAAAAASAATTTASTAATTIAAVATATTAIATAARALCLRTGFIDDEVPATKVLTVETIHGAVGVFVVGNFDESETARLAREAVTNQTDRRRADTHLREPFLQLFFRGAERKIADVKLLHLRTPSARNRTTIAERTEKSNAPRQEIQDSVTVGGRTGQRSRESSPKSTIFATTNVL